MIETYYEAYEFRHAQQGINKFGRRNSDATKYHEEAVHHKIVLACQTDFPVFFHIIINFVFEKQTRGVCVNRLQYSLEKHAIFLTLSLKKILNKKQHVAPIKFEFPSFNES